MKTVILLVALAAVAIAAPQGSSRDAQITRLEFDNIGVDGYKYAYGTSDGNNAEEEGQLLNPGTDNESISVRGQFSFVAPDGQTYTVQYVADENGFQPQGAHLPKTA